MKGWDMLKQKCVISIIFQNTTLYQVLVFHELETHVLNKSWNSTWWEGNCHFHSLFISIMGQLVWCYMIPLDPMSVCEHCVLWLLQVPVKSSFTDVWLCSHLFIWVRGLLVIIHMCVFFECLVNVWQEGNAAGVCDRHMVSLFLRSPVRAKCRNV